MNKLKHAFYPALGVLFAQQIEGDYGQNQEPAIDIDVRQLFYQLYQSGNKHQHISHAYQFITRQLNKIRDTAVPMVINEYSKEALANLYAPVISPLNKPLQTQGNFDWLVNQLAAIQLTQPCWLENIFQISCSQTDPSVSMMAIYLQLTGTAKKGTNVQQLYQSLLLAKGHKLPILHSYDYCQQADLIKEVFDFACIQLALAQFPRVLYAEILGFTLAYCQMPDPLEICCPNQPKTSAFFALRKQQIEYQVLPLQACISSYLNLFSEQNQLLWQRIQNGFWLYHNQMQTCRDRVQQVLQTPLSAQLAVSRLLQQKAVAAIGHHHKVELQGKTLDAWFSELPKNSAEFLLALMQSGYVNQQNPNASPLLKLFEFKGPMFGVLNQFEIDILKNWISESVNPCVKNLVKESVKLFSSDLKQMPTRATLPQKYAKLSNRELYYYLLNADLFPDALPVAQRQVRHSLQRCRWFTRPPFKHYSHQQFDSYINRLYQWEINAYRPLQEPPKISKEAYIWGLEQIAPMILIDGCWLQNSLAVQHSHPEISEILFKIYGDELGNGTLEKNHAHIFLKLLESLSIHLPPVHSESFVQHPGFINNAFDLPIYMLALSRFSVEFLPELLGLNMAIELSGLGKSYMSLVDDWNYWGIDTEIISIHISMDNAASGHTYLAKKAIKLYMDELINRTADVAILDRHWRRIYSGYASLRFVGGRFKLGLPIRYFCSKFTAKNRQ